MGRSTLPWNTKSTRSLIKKVKKYPIIWNKKNPDYGNKSMKTKAFTSIAKLLKKNFPELKELNEELAQKKFTNLRTTYQQEAKKIQESGSEGQVKSNWEYFNDCSFIPRTTKVSTASTGNAVPSTSAVLTATVGSSSNTPEVTEGTTHSTPAPPSQLPSPSMSGNKAIESLERQDNTDESPSNRSNIPMSIENVETPQTSVPRQIAKMSVESDAPEYNMNHRSRGQCVIFNQSHFHSPRIQERKGTDKDCKQVSRVFEHLGFEITIKDNLGVDGINKIIKNLASTDHSECDALAIVFMSHGSEDVLCCNDGTFNPELLFESFQADKCPTLAGKPKLFFIQACRGPKFDMGTNLKPQVDCAFRGKDKNKAAEILSDKEMYSIPNTADTLIVWSTNAGYCSYRDPLAGSWFIQSLVTVLERDSDHEDLLSMMTSVNRYLSTNFEAFDVHKQAASIVSTLMRKVYFKQKLEVSGEMTPLAESNKY